MFVSFWPNGKFLKISVYVNLLNLAIAVLFSAQLRVIEYTITENTFKDSSSGHLLGLTRLFSQVAIQFGNYFGTCHKGSQDRYKCCLRRLRVTQNFGLNSGLNYMSVYHENGLKIVFRNFQAFIQHRGITKKANQRFQINFKVTQEDGTCKLNYLMILILKTHARRPAMTYTSHNCANHRSESCNNPKFSVRC